MKSVAVRYTQQLEAFILVLRSFGMFQEDILRVSYIDALLCENIIFAYLFGMLYTHPSMVF